MAPVCFNVRRAAFVFTEATLIIPTQRAGTFCVNCPNGPIPVRLEVQQSKNPWVDLMMVGARCFLRDKAPLSRCQRFWPLTHNGRGYLPGTQVYLDSQMSTWNHTAARYFTLHSISFLPQTQARFLASWAVSPGTLSAKPINAGMNVGSIEVPTLFAKPRVVRAVRLQEPKSVAVDERNQTRARTQPSPPFVIPHCRLLRLFGVSAMNVFISSRPRVLPSVIL